ncbi:carbohydrate kinase family protein [Paenibacillus guangzhouensis]|uniref:carbohydrate kinase family protein n=1 Tax=Paenibacillus guangzhouensis TaxID=1473112 RepID=UPI0012675678|nr:carbohydrate kinase [Paenibacillus guangzhouensis]
MTDVITLGELLIDFTPYGKSEHGQPLFERNPGGAPANVVAAIARLGRTSGFIGKVGQDAFGHGLRDALASSGVDTTGLVMSATANTTLAFVHLAEDGDRSFSFYRNPGADQLLTVDEVPFVRIAAAKVFHFGSISMTDEPVRSATLAAVQHAKQHGVLVSFDPNLRPALWASEALAKELIGVGLGLADVVKVSEEELEFLTGTVDLEAGSKLLCDQFKIQLLLVTRGGAGSFYRAGSRIGEHVGFAVQAIDTTGAGDAFMAGAIYSILQAGQSITAWSPDQLDSLLTFANAMGALATTRKGGIPAMPTLAEVEGLIQSK